MCHVNVWAVCRKLSKRNAVYGRQRIKHYRYTDSRLHFPAGVLQFGILIRLPGNKKKKKGQIKVSTFLLDHIIFA